MNKRLGIHLLFLALGGVSTWLYLRAPDHAPRAAEPAATPVTTRAPVEMPRLASTRPPDELDEMPEELMAETLELDAPDPAQARAHSLEQLQRSLQIYREFTVYPPWSRPFGENTRHYVDWNVLRPEGQPFAVDEEGRELSVEVSLDRMYAAPGEEIQALVQVGRREEDGTLVPATLDQVTARIEWTEPEKGYSVAQALALEQQGTSYRVSFVPTEIDVLAAGQREAMFTAEVKKGVFFKVIRIPFQYSIRPAFEVVGIAGDRVENGSLVVDLDVEVAHATPTLIQAVLYDASGQTPIAVYDDYFRPTAPGRQIATITFFGKVLRDENLMGPYSIRALHGVARDPGAEVQEIYWKRGDTPLLLTRPYLATQFSGADWSAPEKDEKIAQYEGLIAAGGF